MNGVEHGHNFLLKSEMLAFGASGESWGANL